RAAAPPDGLPPGPRLPMPVQALLWEFRFPQFVKRCRQRYGDTFVVNLPVSGKVVSICDPDLIRTVFADHGDRMHAGEANRLLELGQASRLSLIPQLHRDFGPIRTWSRWLELRGAVDEALYGEISRRRAAPDLAERDDVLSLLLLARDEQGEAMTDVELRDE